MAKTFYSTLLLILFLAACAPPAPIMRPDPPADLELQRIEQLAATGQLDEAARAWLALADERPGQSFQLTLNAVEAWLKDGQADQARSALAGLDTTGLDRRQRARLDLARAELALAEGDLASAGWLLAQAEPGLDGELARRHAVLEQRLRERLEDPTREAFAELERSLYDGDFSPELALALLIEMPLGRLEQLLLDHGHRPELLPWLELVVDCRQYLLDPAALESALNRWEDRHSEVGYQAEEALFWLSIWRQTRPGPQHIAVVLPGRAAMARVSAALRDGLLSAWLELPADRRPKLSFQYVEDEPEAMISALFEAREAGADFMIGPLDRSQVDILLTLPDPGLPILMLNHPGPDVAFSDNLRTIHAIGLPPEEEAELSAVHALVAGHRRALILAQNTDWGERVARSFRTTFELGGGEISGAAQYATEQVDHSALLEVLLELDRSEQRIRRITQVLGQPVEAEPHRRTDIDLVFLAARVEDGRQIRPQLRFFGAGDVELMATSQILPGAPDPRRDQDLDGIVLPLAPWFINATPQGQQRRQAESLFRHLDNPSLSRLHALAADAMSLAPWLDLMRQDPVLYLAGHSGRLRLTEGRLIERDLPFIQLRNGQAVPVQ